MDTLLLWFRTEGLGSWVVGIWDLGFMVVTPWESPYVGERESCSFASISFHPRLGG